MSPKTVRPFAGTRGERTSLPPYTEPRVRWGDPPPRPVVPVEGQLPLPLEEEGR